MRVCNRTLYGNICPILPATNIQVYSTRKKKHKFHGVNLVNVCKYHNPGTAETNSSSKHYIYVTRVQNCSFLKEVEENMCLCLGRPSKNVKNALPHCIMHMCQRTLLESA